jgi:hypothetical protein
LNPTTSQNCTEDDQVACTIYNTTAIRSAENCARWDIETRNKQKHCAWQSGNATLRYYSTTGVDLYFDQYRQSAELCALINMNQKTTGVSTRESESQRSAERYDRLKKRR